MFDGLWLPSRSAMFAVACTTACLVSLRTVLQKRKWRRHIDNLPPPLNLQLNRLRFLGGAASIFVGHLVMEGHASLLPYAKPDPDALSPLSPWLLARRIFAFFTLRWFQLPSESKDREQFFTIQALSYVTSWITSYMGDSFFWRYWFVLLPALTAFSISTVALAGKALATKFEFIERIPALVVEHKHAIRGMILAPLSSVFLADSFQFFQMNGFSMCCAYGFLGMACAAFAMEDFDPSRRTNRWTRYLPSIYLLILSFINLIQDGPSILFLASIVSCWATSVELDLFPHPINVVMQLIGLLLFPIATQGIVVLEDASVNIVLNFTQILSLVLVLAPMFITDKIEHYLLQSLDLILVKIPDTIFVRVIEPVFFKLVPFIYRTIRYGTFFSRMAKRFYGKFIKPILHALTPLARLIVKTVKGIVETIMSWVKYVATKVKQAAVSTAKGGKAVVTWVIRLIRTYLVDPSVALAKKGYNEGIVPLGSAVKRFFIYLFETYMVPVIRAVKRRVILFVNFLIYLFETYMVPVIRAVKKRVILFVNLFALYLCLFMSIVMDPQQPSNSLMAQFIFCIFAGGLLLSAIGIVHFTKKQGPHSSVFWALFNIRVSVLVILTGFMYKGYLGTSLIYSVFYQEPSFPKFEKDTDSFLGTICITAWLLIFRDLLGDELYNQVYIVADEHVADLKAATGTIVRMMWLFGFIQQVLQHVDSTRVSMNFATEYALSSSPDDLASPYYVIARHVLIGMFSIGMLRFADLVIRTKLITEDLDRMRERLLRRNYRRPPNMTRLERFWEFIQTTSQRTAFMDCLFILSGIASFPFPNENFFANLTLLRAGFGYIQIALGLYIYSQNSSSPRWKSILSLPWNGLMYLRRIFYWYSRPVLVLGTAHTLMWSAWSRMSELRTTGTDGFTILWGGFHSFGQLVAAFQFVSVGVIVIGEIMHSYSTKERGCRMFDKIQDVVEKMVDVLDLLLNFSERIAKVMKKLGMNLLNISLEIWREMFVPIFQGLARGFTFIWSNAAASWIASVSTIGLLYLMNRNGLDEAILQGTFALFSNIWNFIPSIELVSTAMGAGRVVGHAALTGMNVTLTGTQQWLFDLRDGRIFENTGFVWALNICFYLIARFRIHRTGDAGYVLGPFLTLTISIMFFKSSVFATLVGCMVWGAMGIIVTHIDRHERRLAQEQFNRMHPAANKAKAGIIMDNLPKESEVKKIFKAEVCAFCYETLDDEPLDDVDKIDDDNVDADENQNYMQVSTLPCGHQFHYGCVQKWFESSNRCPMCREPADQNHFLFQSMF